MRVLLLTQWYPSPESPVYGVFVREHARAISLYHQVNVVFVKGVQGSENHYPEILSEDNGTLVEKTISYPKPRVPKTAWLSRIRQVIKYFERLTASGNRPNIIHANVYNTADLAVLLSKRYHIPAVMTEHATSFPRRLFTPLQALKVRYFINRLQMIMPVSQDLCRHMKAYGIHTPYKVIPPTVDMRLFYPGSRKPSQQDGIHRILVVAYLKKIKGVDLLMQALARLSETGENFRLLIVGDGPERENLTNLSHRLDIASKTTFYGLRNREEVAKMMKIADVLALTSLWENQPGVILEALSSGLPVLASRIAGIPEVLTPAYGRMAEPGNIQSIYENLAYLLNNLSQYSQEGIAAYARSKFSHEEVGLLFSEVYDQVIKDYYHA